MINFIVVEDNLHHQRNTENIITKFMMKNDLEYETLIFPSETKELVKYVKTKNDINRIYILDFEIPGSSAIDIARLIREAGDWKSPIIVYTIYTSMALFTFKKRLQILDYVSKIDKPEKNLYSLFNICMQQLNCFDILRFKIGGVNYNIPFDNILYITRDSYSRKMIVVTNAGEYSFFMALNDVKQKLSNDFIFTHKACITNMKRVEAIDWKNRKVTFDNGKFHDLLTKTHKEEVERYVNR